MLFAHSWLRSSEKVDCLNWFPFFLRFVVQFMQKNVNSDVPFQLNSNYPTSAVPPYISTAKFAPVCHVPSGKVPSPIAQVRKTSFKLNHLINWKRKQKGEKWKSICCWFSPRPKLGEGALNWHHPEKFLIFHNLGIYNPNMFLLASLHNCTRSLIDTSIFIGKLGTFSTQAVPQSSFVFHSSPFISHSHFQYSWLFLCQLVEREGKIQFQFRFLSRPRRPRRQVVIGALQHFPSVGRFSFSLFKLGFSSSAWVERVRTLAQS